MSRKHQESLNLFLDLQRAATALYLNPQGKTHFVFLSHAQKILKDQKSGKELLTKLDRLKKDSLRAITPQESKRIADEILTLGIRLKYLSSLFD